MKCFYWLGVKKCETVMTRIKEFTENYNNAFTHVSLWGAKWQNLFLHAKDKHKTVSVVIKYTCFITLLFLTFEQSYSIHYKFLVVYV